MGAQLEGRVALVTGAASGIGRAIARALSSEGASVAAVDREADGVRTVAAELPGAHAFVADLAELALIPELVADVRDHLGPVDILVNAAGVPAGGPIEADGYEEMWEKTLAVNVTAQVALVRACLADLARNGDGRIVNIASTEALGATINTSPYTVSKHAVVGLTRSLAVELGRRGITTNAVCPGPINTGMTMQIPDADKAAFARRRVPIGRFGEPAEVAHMVLSLVLPGASYVNGAIIPVDGGMTANSR